MSDPAGVRRRREVGDGRRRAEIDHRAFMARGKEAGGEVATVVVGKAPRIGKRDEGREVLVERPEAVGDPRSHARKTGNREPRVHEVAAESVDVRWRRHGHEEREAIDDARDMRKDARDPSSALAVAPELEGALEHAEIARARDGFDPGAASGIEALAVVARESRLGIEGVDLARAAVEEDLDDTPRAGAVVEAAIERRERRGAPAGEGVASGFARRAIACEEARSREEMSERDPAEAAARIEEPAASAPMCGARGVRARAFACRCRFSDTPAISRHRGTHPS